MIQDYLMSWLVSYSLPKIALLTLIMVVFLCEFWGQYVLVMGLYRIYLQDKVSGTKRLHGINTVFGAAHLFKGIVMDVVANIFVAIFFFTPWKEVWRNPLKWEWPREFLVTQRLVRYLATMPADSLQYRRAYWVCHGSLDLFDPDGNHCHHTINK